MKKTIVVKNVDSDTWRRFRSRVVYLGKETGEILTEAIEQYLMSLS